MSLDSKMDIEQVQITEQTWWKIFPLELKLIARVGCMSQFTPFTKPEQSRNLVGGLPNNIIPRKHSAFHSIWPVPGIKIVQLSSEEVQKEMSKTNQTQTTVISERQYLWQQIILTLFGKSTVFIVWSLSLLHNDTIKWRDYLKDLHSKYEDYKA